MHRVELRRHKDALLLERILAARGNGVSLDDKCQVLSQLRSESGGQEGQIDRVLLARIDQLQDALGDAQKNLHQLRETLEQVTAPPWQMGVFLQRVAAAEPDSADRALVYCVGRRQVVNCPEDVEPDAFELGDQVFLNRDFSVLVSKAADHPSCVGEAAVVDRAIDDARLVLKCQNQELVVQASPRLQQAEPQSGDQVRFDRSALIAYEKIERAPSRRYFADEIPDVRPEQVGGQRGNLEVLLAALTTTLLAPEKARAYGLGGRKSILMVGAPGCGKTLMARVAAAEIARHSGRKCSFAAVKPSEWEDPYVGVTQQNIRRCFQALREAAQEGLAVLFLDEIECAGRIRGSAVGHHSDKFLAALLAELDGFSERGGVAIIAATNRKDLVDPALLERISDLEVIVGRPDMRGAGEIFAIHLPAEVPFAANGMPAAGTRREIIQSAVSRLYAPGAENELCTLKFRDGKTRTVVARELLSGRVIEQICHAARHRAFLRDVKTGVPGLRTEDIDEAVSEAIGRLSTLLTPRNAHAYLSDLPQDLDVVAAEPVVRRVSRPHHYLTHE